ncbi:unnamed protein product, partial [Adineta steineri]
ALVAAAIILPVLSVVLTSLLNKLKINK